MGKDFFGLNTISASTEFNYNWTFITPYIDTAISKNTQQNRKAISIEWEPSSSSLIDLSLLTDQSQPILYFDYITIYEDDMHGNGFLSLECKIRVMINAF